MENTPRCWNCQTALGTAPFKITFRASCEACGVDLHCCKGCRFYAPGKPNDCLVPGTEWIRDRDHRNLCEEFALGTTFPPPSRDKQKKFDSLFKEDP